MDNVTHGLWGLGIYAGWAAAAHPAHQPGVAVGVCLAAIVGSEAPDFDYVVKLIFGPVAYLRQHRALSHSIPMWFMWPLIISVILSIHWPSQFWLFYIIAFIGVVIHVALDVLTPYGTQAFWPLSRRRFAFDTLFIVDIVMLICGALAFVMVAAGAWSIGHAVFLMGSIVLFYLALRCVQAAYIYEKVRSTFPSGWRVSTIPGILPWLWSFVAQSDTELMAGKLTLTGEVKRDIHWRWEQRDASAVRFATRFTRLGSVFYWFARHFVWVESQDGENVRLSFADVTYRFGTKFPFMGHITLTELGDGRYEVKEESLKTNQSDVEALLEDAVLSGTGAKTSVHWFSR